MTREQAEAIAEKIAEHLISREGFSENLALPKVVDGIAGVILDAASEFTE